MDPPPPSYDEIENGYPRQPTGVPKPSSNVRRSAPPTTNNAMPQNTSAAVISPPGNAIYTINAAPHVQQQRPGNSTVYISQGQPVYIIPKAAVDEAHRAASFRRNCILCFVITKLIVIAIVVIIVLSTDSS